MSVREQIAHYLYDGCWVPTGEDPAVTWEKAEPNNRLPYRMAADSILALLPAASDTEAALRRELAKFRELAVAIGATLKEDGEWQLPFYIGSKGEVRIDPLPVWLSARKRAAALLEAYAADAVPNDRSLERD